MNTELYNSLSNDLLLECKDKVRALLEEDEALAAELCEKIMASYSGNEVEEFEAVSAEDLFDEE